MTQLPEELNSEVFDAGRQLAYRIERVVHDPRRDALDALTVKTAQPNAAGMQDAPPSAELLATAGSCAWPGAVVVPDDDGEREAQHKTAGGEG